jgi:uncharacterized protein (DUF305 family)
MVVGTAMAFGHIRGGSRQTAAVTSDSTDTERPEQDDDVVVLSWWQHPVNVITLLVGAALIAGMIGWLIADASSEPSGGDVDVGFLQDMRSHHDQAVQMAFMYLAMPDTDPGLRVVARNIVLSQGIDIGRMIQLLRDMDEPEAAPETDEAMAWMGMPTPRDRMPGMATEEQLDEFGASRGAAADQTFVDLMTAHHQGGIHMAEFAATEADNEEVRAMAESLATSQAEEIAELQGLVE